VKVAVSGSSNAAPPLDIVNEASAVAPLGTLCFTRLVENVPMFVDVGAPRVTVRVADAANAPAGAVTVTDVPLYVTLTAPPVAGISPLAVADCDGGAVGSTDPVVTGPPLQAARPNAVLQKTSTCRKRKRGSSEEKKAGYDAEIA
jgi:hypothetical protein